MNQPSFQISLMAWMLGIALCFGPTGCGKTTSSSVQDQNLVPGATKAEPEQPKMAEPEPKIERQAETVAPPGPPEVRVIEPPVVAQEEPPPPEPPRVVKEQPPAAPPVQSFSLSDVFFDFDRAVLRDDAKSVLEANASSLKAEAEKRLVIEGHCDERGTLEYNLVLGEKRAKAVKQYLADLGVASSRLQVTSFGKEKPFCNEHSQDCWQQNRRAHFSPQ